MSAQTKNVVVGYDFGDHARAALGHGIDLANRDPRVMLHVACILAPHHPIPEVEGKRVDIAYADRVETALALAIEEFLHAQPGNVLVHYCTHVRIGKPGEELLGVAEDVGAELIILGGTHQRGALGRMRASVAERVTRDARCSVDVVRAGAYEHVDLLDIVSVEATHHYIPPHRYSYEDHRAQMRPAEWPLY